MVSSFSKTVDRNYSFQNTVAITLPADGIVFAFFGAVLAAFCFDCSLISDVFQWWAQVSSIVMNRPRTSFELCLARFANTRLKHSFSVALSNVSNRDAHRTQLLHVQLFVWDIVYTFIWFFGSLLEPSPYLGGPLRCASSQFVWPRLKSVNTLCVHHTYCRRKVLKKCIQLGFDLRSRFPV